MAHDTVPMESSIYSIAYIEGSDPVGWLVISSPEISDPHLALGVLLQLNYLNGQN